MANEHQYENQSPVKGETSDKSLNFENATSANENIPTAEETDAVKDSGVSSPSQYSPQNVNLLDAPTSVADKVILENNNTHLPVHLGMDSDGKPLQQYMTHDKGCVDKQKGLPPPTSEELKLNLSDVSTKSDRPLRFIDFDSSFASSIGRSMQTGDFLANSAATSAWLGSSLESYGQSVGMTANDWITLSQSGMDFKNLKPDLQNSTSDTRINTLHAGTPDEMKLMDEEKYECQSWPGAKISSRSSKELDLTNVSSLPNQTFTSAFSLSNTSEENSIDVYTPVTAIKLDIAKDEPDNKDCTQIGDVSTNTKPDELMDLLDSIQDSIHGSFTDKAEEDSLNKELHDMYRKLSSVSEECSVVSTDTSETRSTSSSKKMIMQLTNEISGMRKAQEELTKTLNKTNTEKDTLYKEVLRLRNQLSSASNVQKENREDELAKRVEHLETALVNISQRISASKESPVLSPSSLSVSTSTSDIPVEVKNTEMVVASVNSNKQHQLTSSPNMTNLSMEPSFHTPSMSPVFGQDLEQHPDVVNKYSDSIIIPKTDQVLSRFFNESNPFELRQYLAGAIMEKDVLSSRLERVELQASTKQKYMQLLLNDTQQQLENVVKDNRHLTVSLDENQKILNEMRTKVGSLHTALEVVQSQNDRFKHQFSQMQENQVHNFRQRNADAFEINRPNDTLTMRENWQLKRKLIQADEENQRLFNELNWTRKAAEIIAERSGSNQIDEPFSFHHTSTPHLAIPEQQTSSSSSELSLRNIPRFSARNSGTRAFHQQPQRSVSCIESLDSIEEVHNLRKGIYIDLPSKPPLVNSSSNERVGVSFSSSERVTEQSLLSASGGSDQTRKHNMDALVPGPTNESSLLMPQGDEQPNLNVKTSHDSGLSIQTTSSETRCYNQDLPSCSSTDVNEVPAADGKFDYPQSIVDKYLQSAAKPIKINNIDQSEVRNGRTTAYDKEITKSQPPQTPDVSPVPKTVDSNNKPVILKQFPALNEINYNPTAQSDSRCCTGVETSVSVLSPLTSYNGVTNPNDALNMTENNSTTYRCFVSEHGDDAVSRDTLNSSASRSITDSVSEKVRLDSVTSKDSFKSSASPCVTDAVSDKVQHDYAASKDTLNSSASRCITNSVAKVPTGCNVSEVDLIVKKYVGQLSSTVNLQTETITRSSKNSLFDSKEDVNKQRPNFQQSRLSVFDASKQKEKYQLQELLNRYSIIHR